LSWAWQKSLCSECGGSGLYKHGQRKDRCRECGRGQAKEALGGLAHMDDPGAASELTPKQPRPARKQAKCPHGKAKWFCIECGGSGLCRHEKLKSKCRECGGSNFCQHGKQKSLCSECGGSGLCKHGQRKDRCRTCADMAGVDESKVMSCGLAPVLRTRPATVHSYTPVRVTRHDRT